MSDIDKDHQRFAELLPFFVNGTLGAEDRQWIEEYRSRHPESRNEQRFVEMLRDVSRNISSVVPESQRLERLLSEWKQTRAAPSLLQKLKSLFQAPIRIPAAAFAAFALLVVAQSVFIGSLVTDRYQETAFRGERPECISTPRIRVVFNPDAKHFEIMLLLRKLEISVQEGPSETGEFWLMVPKGRSVEEAQSMLRSSLLVEESMVTRDTRPGPGCVK